jgi:hypothetical protein
MNFDFLIEKEKCLELDEYRLSKAKLSELISKDFMEVRSNGDIENKLEVIEGIFEDNEVGLNELLMNSVLLFIKRKQV